MNYKTLCKTGYAGLLALLACAPVHALDLKIATIAPDGTAWMQEMRAGAGEISKRTDGRVNFKFYPGGAMGNDKNVLRKIRAGQLQGGALTGGGLAEVYQDNQIYNLPLMFRSYEEMDYVRSKMDSLILKGLGERGFVSFGLAEGGFAYLMSSGKIDRIDNLRKEKVWVPDGDMISRTMFETLGVPPIPLPLTDVLTGLQTGLITTIGASSTGAIALQWHTKIRYVLDAPLMYFYGAMVVDRKAFDKMSAPDQAVVREVMQRVFDKLNRQIRQDNENAVTALRQQGIEFLQLPPDELARLHLAAEQAIKRLGEKGTYTPEMLKTIQSHLDAYRRKNNRAAGRH
jgi:TRAP-type C4-dicarboxylate transport system substrate-binding protein